MSLPYDRPCIFCGGVYTKMYMAKGYEGYEISTLIISKIGTDGIEMVRSVIYQCETCGNIQSFAQREPVV